MSQLVSERVREWASESERERERERSLINTQKLVQCKPSIIAILYGCTASTIQQVIITYHNWSHQVHTLLSRCLHHSWSRSSSHLESSPGKKWSKKWSSKQQQNNNKDVSKTNNKTGIPCTTIDDATNSWPLNPACLNFHFHRNILIGSFGGWHWQRCMRTHVQMMKLYFLKERAGKERQNAHTVKHVEVDGSSETKQVADGVSDLRRLQPVVGLAPVIKPAGP